MDSYLFGLLDLSFWGLAAAAFIMVQISMAGVTLYLHRDQAHRAIDLHPVIRHFFRLWIYMTSGMITRDWVAVHRKHHAMVEREGDPHSPVVFGLGKVLKEGAELYAVEAAKSETLDKYGRGCPDDWLERNFYERYRNVGLASMLLIDLALFGVAGITIWAIQMLAMPVCAAGIINGLGHARGYRNFESDDASTNMTPIAVLIGGEELHNNHHAFPTSAKFSVRWWEFDIGWFYISILSRLGLCKVRRVAQVPVLASSPRTVDMETLKAVLQHRMHVFRDFSRQVMLPVLQNEIRANRMQTALGKARRVLMRRPQLLDDAALARRSRLLADNAALRTVHEYREQLQSLWEQANVSNEALVRHLRDWCARAEASGIRALQDFSAQLRGYIPQTA
jgi:stearoyl-CoA desaturase (delta-9 desaturase)